MALLGFTGFDNFGNATTSYMPPLGWTLTGAGPSIDLGGGVRGGNALRIASSASVYSANRVFGSNKTRAGLGMNLYFDYIGTGEAGVEIAALIDGSTNQITLYREAVTGLLKIYKGTPLGTLLQTSSVSLNLYTYHYIEFWATIGDTGSYEVRLNGETILSGSGVDTSATANQFATGFRLGRTQSSSPVNFITLYDDVYWADDTGASYNTFLGPIRVDTLTAPTVNGTYAEFTPSTGTNHALLIDETAPNNTDYIDGATSGLRDTFDFGNLPALTVDTIYAVQVNTYAWKDDAGARSIRNLVRSSGVDETSSTDGVLTTSASFYSSLHLTKPGGGAWTQADVNAAEFGVQVVA